MNAATIPDPTVAIDARPGNRWNEHLLSHTARAPSWIWVGSYLFVLISIWSLVGRYHGITHDAVLYLLQAVSKLTPDPLAQDIFLRYESQDRFTIFSTACAWVVDIVGVDRAAASLTAIFLVGWYSAAWAITRSLQNGRLALLSLALLLFIPGAYGAMGVFRHAEPFMTPRSLAEALSLTAILALLRSRHALAIALILLALLTHPLMAFPAVLLSVLYALPLDGWRGWTAVTAAIVVGALVGSLALGLPAPLMQGEWLETTRLRSAFLFTDLWGPADWETQAQVLATLTLGLAAVSGSQTRKILASALCVGLAGLALAVLASQTIELKVLLQGQPWRWLWVGRFFATALLPVIVLSLWRNGPAGRSSAVLLAAAWILSGAGSLRDLPPIGVSGLLCFLAVIIWLARASLSSVVTNALRVLEWGVITLVGAVFVSFIVVSMGNDFSFGRDPVWVQRVHDVVGVPGIATALAAIAWALLIVDRRRRVLVPIVGIAGVLLAGAGPEAARRWTAISYGEVNRAKFAEWRAIIPREAEVLWGGSVHGPWFLLDRRTYMSVAQASGVVFSRETAAELQRRAQVLTPLVDSGMWFMNPKPGLEEVNELTPEIMSRICIDPALGFVVARERFEGAVANATLLSPRDLIYLYDCRTFRQGQPG